MSMLRASVLGLGWVALSLSLSVVACSADPTPRGYHSPNVAWSRDELGLVWLNRRAPYEAVVFARAGKDAKQKAPEVELTQHAWHSEPPLIASDGEGWLVAWTQAGGRDPGLFVRAVGPGGPEGPAHAIVEAAVSPCPQLVWIGDAYVIGWREADGIRLGRLDAHGQRLDASPAIGEAASIAGCRVAWGEDELGVLWAEARGEAHALALARVSATGQLREVVEVRTAEPPAAGLIDLAWHDDAWVVAYASPDRTGARTVRVTPAGTQTPGPALGSESHVGGLGLASKEWLGAVWSEVARPGAGKGRIVFDVLEGTRQGRELGAGRPRVNLAAHDSQRAAATWSSISGNTTAIHWVVLGVRSSAGALAIEGAPMEGSVVVP